MISTTTFLGREVTVPESVGSIVSVTEGTSGKGIIVLQDAHAHLLAQKNIATLILYFLNKYGWNLVCVEGGSRNGSLTHMRSDAPKAERAAASEKLLTVAKIGGENYVDRVHDVPVMVWGVEDPEKYDAQMMSICHMCLPRKGDTESLADRADRVLWDLEDRLREGLIEQTHGKFADLFELQDAVLEEYQLGSARRLRERAVVLPGWGDRWAAFRNHMDIEDARPPLPFAAAEEQCQQFLRKVTAELPAAEAETLRRQWQCCQTEQSPMRKWGYIDQHLTSRAGLAEGFRDLHAQARYHIQLESREPARIIDDRFDILMNLRELCVEEHGTDESGDWNDVLRRCEMLRRICTIQANPRDYIEQDPLPFEEVETLDVSLDGIDVGDLRDVLDRQDAAAKFYRAGEARTDVMISNAVARRDEFGYDALVLITGGFHTPQLVRDDRSDSSILVVAPRLQEPSAARLGRLMELMRDPPAEEASPGTPQTPPLTGRPTGRRTRRSVLEEENHRKYRRKYVEALMETYRPMSDQGDEDLATIRDEYEIADTYVQVGKKKRKPDSTRDGVGYALCMLAEWFQVHGNLDEADEHANLALARLDGEPDANAVERARTLQVIGCVQRERGDFDRAVGTLEQALQSLDQPDADAARVAEVRSGLLFELSTVLESCGDSRRADETRQAAIQAADKKTAEALVGTVRRYADEPLHDVTEMFQRRAIAVYGHLEGEQSLAVARELSILSSLLLRQGRYEEARHEAAHAVEIVETHFEAGDSELSSSYSQLASALILLKEYAKAETLFRQAVTVREQNGDSDADLLTLQSIHARCLIECNRMPEAKAVLTLVLDRVEELGLRDDPIHAMALTRLAQVHIESERFDDAEHACRRAMVIHSRPQSQYHPLSQPVHRSLPAALLARLVARRGQRPLARQTFQQAVKDMVTAYGPKHPLVTDFVAEFQDVAAIASDGCGVDDQLGPLDLQQPEAQYAVAHSHMLRGELEAALSVSEPLTLLAWTSGRLLRGQLLSMAGKFSQAAEMFSPIGDTDGFESERLLQSGLNAWRAGDYATAVDQLRAAREQGQDALQTILCEGIFLIRSGRETEIDALVAQTPARHLNDSALASTVQWLAGKLSDDELLALAKSPKRLCGISYWIGEKRRAQGRVQEGDALIRQALETGATTLYEYQHALAISNGGRLKY